MINRLGQYEFPFVASVKKDLQETASSELAQEEADTMKPTNKYFLERVKMVQNSSSILEIGKVLIDVYYDGAEAATRKLRAQFESTVTKLKKGGKR